MQLLSSINVIHNILKILGFGGGVGVGFDDSYYDQFDIKLQISLNTDNSDFINFSLVHYFEGLFVIFTRIIVSINEFEEITEENSNWAFLLDKEYIKKIILLHKFWPKKFINFSVDFDVVTLKLVESLKSGGPEGLDIITPNSNGTNGSNGTNPYYTFITSFSDENIIIEPVLLKHTCVINLEEFKRLIELCYISKQKIIFELDTINEVLKVKNEHSNINASTKVFDVKKIKPSYNVPIILENQYIPFILNRLQVLTSQSQSKIKMCMLYLEKGNPFVIEYMNSPDDSNNNTRIYLTHL